MTAPPAKADVALARVLIVNTSDFGGGAERSVMALADAFEQLGTQVRVAVGHKQTSDPRVIELHASPHIDYRPYATRRHRLQLTAARRLDAGLGLEDFRYPFSHRLLDLTGDRPNLVLCNNLHGGFFDLRVLGRLSAELPVVLRLSDSWAFTGHCACTGGCARWEHGCGRCPDLTAPPAIHHDATWINWRRKRRIFDAAPGVALIAPSLWMLERARRSLLGPDREAVVIHSGVDLATFRPGSRPAARDRVGIEGDATVLLFVANGGSENPFKDFATVEAAFRLLVAARPALRLLLVVVGGSQAARAAVGAHAGIRRVPYVASQEEMAEWFRAADVYVHSAPEDTLPLALIEALACGIPSVSTDVGGTAECVDDGENGFLVPPASPERMTSALTELVDDARARQRMGRVARELAGLRFDAASQLVRVHEWCAEFAARRARH